MASYPEGELAKGLIGLGISSPESSFITSPFLHPCTTMMDDSHFFLQVQGPGM